MHLPLKLKHDSLLNDREFTFWLCIRVYIASPTVSWTLNTNTQIWNLRSYTGCCLLIQCDLQLTLDLAMSLWTLCLFILQNMYTVQTVKRTLLNRTLSMSSCITWIRCMKLLYVYTVYLIIVLKCVFVFYCFCPLIDWKHTSFLHFRVQNRYLAMS